MVDNDDHHSTRRGLRRLLRRNLAVTSLTLSDPLFVTYVIAATLIILKAVSMSWLR